MPDPVCTPGGMGAHATPAGHPGPNRERGCLVTDPLCTLGGIGPGATFLDPWVAEPGTLSQMGRPDPGCTPGGMGPHASNHV